MVVADSDPFSDSVFLTRLAKLLPMLGSEQPGEAEAARHKLGEFLHQHRLTFLDLAQRLAASPGAAALAARANSLERQVQVARAAKSEADREANAANHRLHVLGAELEQSNDTVARLAQSERRLRALAAVGWCVGIIAAAILIGPGLMRSGGLHRVAYSTQGTANIEGPVHPQAGTPEQSDPAMHLLAGERPGEAAVQDLPIRLSPNDDATVRAFLNIGEHLAIRQEARVGGQNWLLVRTTTGTGWVRAGDVLH